MRISSTAKSKNDPCIEYQLTQVEALRCLIQSHRPSIDGTPTGVPLVGHDFEPHLQEKARANQSAGGKNKGSSSLTEAESLDVRSEISAVTGVSAGNLTKVKNLKKQAHPRVEQALRNGGLSIHKAWILSQLPSLRQVRELEDHQAQKGLSKTSRELIRRHAETLSPAFSPRATLADLLSSSSESLIPGLDSIAVAEIDFPGRIAYLRKTLCALLQTSEGQNERSESAEADIGRHKGIRGIDSETRPAVRENFHKILGTDGRLGLGSVRSPLPEKSGSFHTS